MGPDWAHGIFGIPVAHGRMVGAGYFTYPRGSNFNGVVTTKLLAFFSRLVALQGASLFHQVRPRARRNLLEHELAGAGSHNMCVHQLRLNQCVACNGSYVCPHDKRKNQCRICSPSAFCVHGKRNDKCHVAHVCFPHFFCLIDRKTCRSRRTGTAQRGEWGFGCKWREQSGGIPRVESYRPWEAAVSGPDFGRRHRLEVSPRARRPATLVVDAFSCTFVRTRSARCGEVWRGVV